MTHTKPIHTSYALVILLAFVLHFAFTGNGGAETPLQYRQVEVHSGDTLWSLAERHGSEKQDIRELVFHIRELNQIADSGALTPGTLLRIPVTPEASAADYIARK